MDPRTADRGIDDRGVTSVQFLLASGLALILFLVLANLVVVQYGRGAVRSALEQGARAGTTAGPAVCEQTAGRVIEDLLGGRMSDGLVVGCDLSGESVVATATGAFESWTPLTPDFGFELTSRGVTEP
ncbi:MAG: hypothetical protein ACLFRT_03915 [Actinomycetota bacterium]